MRVFSLITQKGGSGKTTLATSLAVAAAEAGETVALLDLDPQGMAAAWGDKRDKAQEKATRAGNTELAARLAKPHVEAIPARHVPTLPKLITSLEGKFSVVILDTQGSDNVASHLVMQITTLCLVPIRPTSADAEMAMPTISALMNGKRRFAFILTQCSTIPNNSRAAEMSAGLRGFGVLAEPLIHLRAAYQDAYTFGLGPTEQAPKDKAAEEVRSLWENLDIMTKKDR